MSKVWYRHPIVSLNRYTFLLSEQTQHTEHYADIYYNMFKKITNTVGNRTRRRTGGLQQKITHYTRG